MQIHGLRFYLQSVNATRGDNALIYVHRPISVQKTDFFYIFSPLADVWCGQFFATDFGVRMNNDGTIDDPIPTYREELGTSFFDADLLTQLMLLRGDRFAEWGSTRHFQEGALLPVFREPPSFKLVQHLFWNREFRLTPDTWPPQMSGLLHMWDDIYWQIFTPDRSQIDTLIRWHAGDPKLNMFIVDLEREFPDPSNEELQPATLPEPP